MQPRKDLLKGGVNACLIFPKADPFASTSRVLAWLSRASPEPFTQAQLAAEVDTIRARPRGDQVAERAKELGLPAQHAGVNAAYARCLGLTPLQVGEVKVCVDVLNLDNELGWSMGADALVEVFVVGGRPSEGFFQASTAMTKELQAGFCFGGAGSFMAGFLDIVAREAAALSPADFLWPITVIHRELGTLAAPVFRLNRLGDYIGIQVEDDLFAGHPQAYERVGKELGLRTLWTPN